MRITEQQQKCLALAVAALIAAAAVVAVSAGDEPTSSNTGPRVGEVAGSYASVTPKDLFRISDIVVRGTAIDQDTRRFADNAAASRAAKRRAAEAGLRTYYDLRFKVDEYLKGSGPRVISIRRRAPSGNPRAAVPDLPWPQRGERQLLFADAGKSMWAGGFLLQGPYGVADIRNGQAVFAFPLASGKRAVDLERIAALKR